MKKIVYILILLFASNLYSQDFYYKVPPLHEEKIDLRLPKIKGDGLNLRDGSFSENEKITLIFGTLMLVPTTLSLVGLIQDPQNTQFYGVLAYDCVMTTIIVIAIH